MIVLTLLALGDKAKNPLYLLANLCSQHQCNILNCYMSTLSGQQCFILLIGGNWSDVAKLEASFPSLQAEQGMTLISTRPPSVASDEGYLPYTAQLIGVDSPGTIGTILQFFIKQQIPVEALRSETISFNSTPINTLTLAINVPANLSIADLRDQFLILCDEINIDGNLEPDRR
jgi:glycine cleavage system transcriptional repressor